MAKYKQPSKDGKDKGWCGLCGHDDSVHDGTTEINGVSHDCCSSCSGGICGGR